MIYIDCMRYLRLPVALVGSVPALLIATPVVAALANPGFESGDLTSWSCVGTCTVESEGAYEGSYYATRGSESQLSQVEIAPECSTYGLTFAAREAAAGSHTISAGFVLCGLAGADYVPGEEWALYNLQIPACPDDDQLIVIFAGDGSTDIDAVTTGCVGYAASPDAGEALPDLAYIGELEGGDSFAVYRSATFGELALFLPAAGLVAIQVLLMAILVSIRRRLVAGSS